MTQTAYDNDMEKNKNLIIRLTPKSSQDQILRGFPWVYDNELVLDRITKTIPLGSIAILQSAERKQVGLVTFNPISKIPVRILDLNLEAKISLSWITDKISCAITMRNRLYEQPYYRLVHAEVMNFPVSLLTGLGILSLSNRTRFGQK